MEASEEQLEEVPGFTRGRFFSLEMTTDKAYHELEMGQVRRDGRDEIR